MWDNEGTTRVNMMEILISLALLKLRILHVDLLLNNYVICFNLYFYDGLMTILYYECYVYSSV